MRWLGNGPYSELNNRERMPQDAPSKQPRSSEPSYATVVVVALMGLVVGVAKQEWHLCHTFVPADQSLQTGEKAFRAGDEQDAVSIFRKLAIKTTLTHSTGSAI